MTIVTNHLGGGYSYQGNLNRDYVQIQGIIIVENEYIDYRTLSLR
jgi:hypothetical protein